jgi:hypothetical protein
VRVSQPKQNWISNWGGIARMTYDLSRVGALSGRPTERFVGAVFRATQVAAKSIAPSVRGGRWAPPGRPGAEIPVLYASVERDGALAEVASYLVELSPIPGPRSMMVTRLAVSTSRTLRLARVDLEALGVDMSRYGVRDYARTQEIGAAAASVGIDGLIAPSARWSCDNLMIFTDNLDPRERLEAVGSEEIEWRGWARAHGFPGA